MHSAAWYSSHIWCTTGCAGRLAHFGTGRHRPGGPRVCLCLQARVQACFVVCAQQVLPAVKCTARCWRKLRHAGSGLGIWRQRVPAGDRGAERGGAWPRCCNAAALPAGTGLCTVRCLAWLSSCARLASTGAPPSSMPNLSCTRIAVPLLQGVRVAQVAAGGMHSVALTDEGEVHIMPHLYRRCRGVYMHAYSVRAFAIVCRTPFEK
jgi:hypothetical protein